MVRLEARGSRMVGVAALMGAAIWLNAGRGKIVMPPITVRGTLRPSASVVGPKRARPRLQPLGRTSRRGWESSPMSVSKLRRLRTANRTGWQTLQVRASDPSAPMSPPDILSVGEVLGGNLEGVGAFDEPSGLGSKQMLSMERPVGGEASSMYVAVESRFKQTLNGTAAIFRSSHGEAVRISMAQRNS